MLKKIVMGSIAAATMTASAYAADLPARMAPPPPPPVPVCIWCGAYIGVNGGGAWMTRNGWGNNGNNDVFVETVGVGGVIFPVSAGVINNGNGNGFFNNGSNNQVGGFGGGQIGINWQWGMFVAGGELDFQGSRINANGVGAATNIFGGLTTINTVERLDYFGTARGRVGIAFGGP
ncbi:MAG: porin family protein, partial [Bradyrhizobium sp.]|nr:porin family protein [Bradyrhizobium sp.]